MLDIGSQSLFYGLNFCWCRQENENDWALNNKQAYRHKVKQDFCNIVRNTGSFHVRKKFVAYCCLGYKYDTGYHFQIA